MTRTDSKSSERRPRLAITIGDPAGVGPEIIAAAWTDPHLHKVCRPFVIGSPSVMRKACALNTASRCEVTTDMTDETQADSRTMPVLEPEDQCDAPDGNIQAGVVDARAGAMAYAAITKAAELALAGEVDGIVTAPIHKQSFREAGIEFPGHTELFAQMCGVEEFAMMLYRPAPQGLSDAGATDSASAHPSHQTQQRVFPGLGVAHVTLHLALRDIFSNLTSAAIVAKAKLLHEMLTALHSSTTSNTPRIGIAALNPHGGEAGLFGREEIEIIAPAVETAKALGLNVHGPVPADTLFRHAAAGAYDGVVAMYHDQGHIALKLLGIHDTVNVTLGLPIVRTSVAHGTAFDIAWQGKAAPDSLLQAIDVAAKLASARLRA